MCKADYTQSRFPGSPDPRKHTIGMVSSYALQSILFARVPSFFEWLLREQVQNIPVCTRLRLLKNKCSEKYAFLSISQSKQ